MLKYLFAFAALMVIAPKTGARGPVFLTKGQPGNFSVMTYNVRGLRWPIATDRSGDLESIGDRLAALRSVGRQPHVLVLQEAFTDNAAAIGARAGYRYRANGPDRSAENALPMSAADRMLEAGARWLKGEAIGKWEGSGLRIYSDYPIVRIERMAFPSFACAGFDCLSNKGALLVTVATPDGRVEIVATHLNSRHASGVPDARSLQAYRRQVELLSEFIRQAGDSALPLIVTGDFNASAPARVETLLRHAQHWRAGGRDGLRTCLGEQRVDREDTARTIIRRSRDFQFVFAGRKAPIAALSAQIPFGPDFRGRMFSDHIGFAITYRMGHNRLA